MRALALMMMFFGWLIYGTLSAWAGCPTCASMNMAAQPEASSAHAAHHDMSRMPMADMASREGSAKDPCSTGVAHMPLCGACMVLPVAAPIADGGKHVFAYPSPALHRALRDNRPAPQAPPPRLI